MLIISNQAIININVTINSTAHLPSGHMYTAIMVL